MNQIAIRRNKIAKELSKQQKEKYFQQRRQQILTYLQTETAQELTQEIKWLRTLIHRSLIKNELLSEIKYDNLLEQVERRMRQISSVRQIELILVLCSNILLDQISVDQKQKTVSLCLEAICLSQVRAQLQLQQSRNITFMLSITHTIISLIKAAKFIDQSMAVQCEQQALTLLLIVLQKLSQVIMKDVQSLPSQKQYHIVQKICQEIVSSLLLYLLYEQQYLNQTNLKFSRSLAIFKQILDIHFKLISSSHNMTILDEIIHEGLLKSYEIVSEKVQTLDFPIFFNDKSLFYIILTNIILQSSQYSTVTDIPQQIKDIIVDKDKEEIFFRNLLLRDRSQVERLKLAREIIKNEQIFCIFNTVFLQNWNELIDICCQVINQGSNDYDFKKLALQILILCCNKQIQDYKPIPYLRNLGANHLFQKVLDGYFNEDGGIEKQIGDYCYYLQQIIVLTYDQLYYLH